MSAVAKKWLWEMLSYDLGIDEGRTVLEPASGLLVSAFQVLSEHNNKSHLIKTIATGFEVTQNDVGDELVVIRVAERQYDADEKQWLYLAHLEGGKREWFTCQQFFSDDGTVTDSFLDFASAEDIDASVDTFTIAQLKKMCEGQVLKSTGSRLRLVKRLGKFYKKSQVSQPQRLPTNTHFAENT